MKQTVFTGAATAIITPMTEKGVDYENFERLINWQIDEGIDAIVAVGSTGEGATLNDEEHRKVLQFAVDTVKGRVPLIAGTGSNDIAYAVSLTEYACSIGVDAVLTVTPYYNKGTQNGLIKSFATIADHSTKPVILYNVPSRTGCNLLPESCSVLADHPRIHAIKEASGNLAQIAKVASLTRGRLDIYSGNDDETVPILSIGGKGVISVISNLLPKQTSEMCHAFFRGENQKAMDMQLESVALVNALFSEVNPIPVKCAMAHMGFGENYLRLPLTPMEEAHEMVLVDLMKKAGIEIVK